jgi:hypothetical protein
LGAGEHEVLAILVTMIDTDVEIIDFVYAGAIHAVVAEALSKTHHVSNCFSLVHFTLHW